MSSHEIFSSIKEVLHYLKDNDWKISERTLYRHIKQGLLRPDSQKNFHIRKVKAYAKNHLLAAGAVQKLKDEHLQRTKLKKEIILRDEEIKIRRLKRMVEEGKYILRDEVCLELAGRAAVLDVGLKAMVQTRAGEFIQMVGGNGKKTADLVREMMTEIDNALNEFSKDITYEVVFEGPEESDGD